MSDVSRAIRGSAAADRQVAFELGVLALSELVATFSEESDVDLPRLGSMLIIALANSALGTGGVGQSSEAVCRASWVLVWLRQQGVAVRSGASAKLMSATSVALTKQSSGTMSPPCPPCPHQHAPSFLSQSPSTRLQRTKTVVSVLRCENP